MDRVTRSSTRKRTRAPSTASPPPSSRRNHARGGRNDDTERKKVEDGKERAKLFIEKVIDVAAFAQCLGCCRFVDPEFVLEGNHFVRIKILRSPLLHQP